jgi:hypothetical protein
VIAPLLEVKEVMVIPHRPAPASSSVIELMTRFSASDFRAVKVQAQMGWAVLRMSLLKAHREREAMGMMG